MNAGAQISEQAKQYAEVVRNINKALIAGSQDQFDAVSAFLAACPEEQNGQLLLCMCDAVAIMIPSDCLHNTDTLQHLHAIAHVGSHARHMYSLPKL